MSTIMQFGNVGLHHIFQLIFFYILLPFLEHCLGHSNDKIVRKYVHRFPAVRVFILSSPFRLQCLVGASLPLLVYWYCRYFTVTPLLLQLLMQMLLVSLLLLMLRPRLVFFSYCYHRVLCLNFSTVLRLL